MNQVIVRYHHSRALLTLDLNALFDTLFREYGDELSVEFIAMEETERNETQELRSGLFVIRERFRILEKVNGQSLRRRPDLEQDAVRMGQK